MKRLTKILFLMLAASLSAVSCRKGEPDAALTGNIFCKVWSDATKAVAFDENSLKDSGFVMTAFIDDDYFITGDQQTPSGKAGLQFGPSIVSCSSDVWSIPGTPKWVQRDSTRFWCWSPKIAAGTRVINPDSTSLLHTNKLKFTYELPAGGAVAAGKACDATKQEDLIFAYNCRWYDPQSSEASSEEVNLRFYHALAQINFIVYPLATNVSGDGSLRSDYTIVDIALQGLSNSATCEITGRPYYEMPEEGAGMTTFSWSEHSGSGSYTQNYGVNFSAASPSSVPSGWIYKDYGGKAHYYCTNAFFIIPETIGDVAAVAVTFQKDATKVTKLAKLKGVGTANRGTAAVTAWEAGLRYTYRLAISGDITDPTELSVQLENWETVNDSMRF